MKFYPIFFYKSSFRVLTNAIWTLLAMRTSQPKGQWEDIYVDVNTLIKNFKYQWHD